MVERGEDKPSGKPIISRYDWFRARSITYLKKIIGRVAVGLLIWGSVGFNSKDHLNNILWATYGLIAIPTIISAIYHFGYMIYYMLTWNADRFDGRIDLRPLKFQKLEKKEPEGVTAPIQPAPPKQVPMPAQIMPQAQAPTGAVGKTVKRSRIKSLNFLGLNPSRYYRLRRLRRQRAGFVSFPLPGTHTRFFGLPFPSHTSSIASDSSVLRPLAVDERISVDDGSPEDLASLIVDLKDAADPQRFGGKLSNLAGLIALGYRVPEGMGIPKEFFERFVAERNTLQRVEAIYKRYSLSETSELSVKEAAAKAIQRLFVSRKLPADIEAALRQQYQLLNGRILQGI